MRSGGSNPFWTGPRLWAIVAVAIGVNLWYDYYHPLGLIVDGIVIVVLLFKWLSDEWPSDRNGQ